MKVENFRNRGQDKTTLVRVNLSRPKAYFPSLSWSGCPALFSVTWSCERAPLFGIGAVWARGSGFGSERGCEASRTSTGGALWIGVIIRIGSAGAAESLADRGRSSDLW